MEVVIQQHVKTSVRILFHKRNK
jgi:hypothetical protein